MNNDELFSRFPAPLPVPTLHWKGNHLVIVDQRLLPEELILLHLETTAEVADAIKTLAVRGAPAIGAAAAYGVCLADKKLDAFIQACTDINVRPTAVNLQWAVRRMKSVIKSNPDANDDDLRELLINEARFIADEDRRRCRLMGMYGAEILEDGMTVHTHCNAGAMATVDYGTALGVVFTAVALGKRISVIADETRPLLQGSRITAWECLQAGIPVTVICDSMAGLAMSKGMTDVVVVGADRVAANGDVANKIGTYPLAVMAKEHGIPFYVAAPTSTIDLSSTCGDDIPIEKRNVEEIAMGFGKRTAPISANFYNPAFDITPHKLIAGIITEGGIVTPPYEGKLTKVVEEYGLPEP